LLAFTFPTMVNTDSDYLWRPEWVYAGARLIKKYVFELGASGSCL
jgi:hypothetical protein